jgi:hypothetical protein
VTPAAPAQREPDEPICERPQHLRVISQSPPIELDAAEHAVRTLPIALDPAHPGTSMTASGRAGFGSVEAAE